MSTRPVRLLDLLEDVLAGLTGQGLRTVGLAAVFALGSAGLVSALGISATASRQVQQRLTAAALDQVTAHPLATSDGDASTASQPALPADAVERALRIDSVRVAGRSWSVRAVPGMVTRIRIGSPGALLDERLTVIGMTPSLLAVYDATTRPSQAAHLLRGGSTPRVAVLGRKAATALGVTAPGPGVRIRVADVPVEVIGIVTSTERAPGLDRAVLIPPALARSVGGEQAEESLVVRTEPGRAFAVSQVLAKVLRPDRPSAVEVEPAPDLRLLRRGVSTDLDSAAAILSAVMLALAAITSTNVMTMTVNNRRPEIALRRAVGMSRWTVGLTFLGEGAVVGAFGGIVGSAVGVVATVVTAYTQDWQPILPAWLGPAGLVCGLAVGLLAASRAALRAARTQPALAIRT